MKIPCIDLICLAGVVEKVSACIIATNEAGD